MIPGDGTGARQLLRLQQTRLRKREARLRIVFTDLAMAASHSLPTQDKWFYLLEKLKVIYNSNYGRGYKRLALEQRRH